jgi:hypothetical protein
VRQHDQGDVPVPGVVAADLVLVEAGLVLRALEALLNRPPLMPVTATQLGLLLAETGRHTDAITTLLDAAVLWHQQTGRWDTSNLRRIRRERAAVSPDAFSQLAAVRQSWRPVGACLSASAQADVDIVVAVIVNVGPGTS